MSSSTESRGIDLRWLLQLRWAAAVCQAAVVVVADWVLRVALPLVPLLAIVGVVVGSNAACALCRHRVERHGQEALFGLLVLDVVLLTALLYFSGGPANPFAFLFLVHIALGAVVLRPRWAWLLLAVAMACCGVLFVDHVELVADHEHSAATRPAAGGDHTHEGALDAHAHLRDHIEHVQMHGGLWLGISVASLFVVYFVGRVRRALAEREQELRRERDRTARSEKLASLATLAAGAAHELATPLSTIAVVAKELERNLKSQAEDDDAIADARLIRQQVERCRQVLSRLAADADHSDGDHSQLVRVEQLITDATRNVAPSRLTVDIPPDAGERELRLPRRDTAQVLRALLDNAVFASADEEPVELSARVVDDELHIIVRDDGEGMTPEVLSRAAEPFFTTRQAGEGMGLGLFVSRALLERLGGRLELSSGRDEGTTATVVVPLSASEQPVEAHPPSAAHRMPRA